MRLRVQIVVAAVVVATGLVAGLLAMSDRRPRLAGTNSVGPSSPVVRVGAGERLCVARLRVPPAAASASVFLALAPTAPVKVDLRLDASGPPVRSRAVAAAPGELRFPLARVRAGAPARLCLRPGGPIELSGTRSEPFAGVNYLVRGADVFTPPNATLDGRPARDLVSVRFVEARTSSRLA